MEISFLEVEGLEVFPVQLGNFLVLVAGICLMEPEFGQFQILAEEPDLYSPFVLTTAVAASC